MELIRKENGNVELRNSGVLVWSMAQLPVEIKPIDKEERDHVKLFQNDGRVEYIYVDDLTETQIEPNAAVPFAGTVFDLADLLSADFFFEVINGGGGTANFEYLSDPGAFHTLQGDISPNIGQGAQGVTLVAQLIRPLGDFTISNISINIISGVIGNAVVGIYDINNSGYPDNKLTQTTQFNTNVTGLQTITIPNFQLKGGTNYAVVFQCSSPIPNMQRFGYLSTNTGLIWGTDGVSTKYGLLNIANIYSATLPNVFPAGAALNSQPLIAVYFQ